MLDPAVPVTISPAPADDLWSVDERSLDLFARQLDAPPLGRPRVARLVRAAARGGARRARPGFRPAHHSRRARHQGAAAPDRRRQRLLRQMGGRALLADEVGLGKTIEASIIYREPAIRRLARRAPLL